MSDKKNLPRSPYDLTGGIVYFARMLHKIRLHDAKQLPVDYHGPLGKGNDGRCCQFLGVEYSALQKQVLAGHKDEEILEWCFAQGKRPSEEEIFVWNGFMTKRGWRDDGTPILEKHKTASGLANRPDIATFFEYYEFDEGRKS